LRAENAATGPVGERVPINRIKDYLAFALWFAGLCYLALWLVSTRDRSLAACQAVPVLLHRVCEIMRDPALPPGLHAIGLVAVTAVLVHGVWLTAGALRRRWRRQASPPNPEPSSRRHPAMTATQPLRRSNIQPRQQFGLRGIAR
jgi:hypothetical protein